MEVADSVLSSFVTLEASFKRGLVVAIGIEGSSLLERDVSLGIWPPTFRRLVLPCSTVTSHSLCSDTGRRYESE